MNLTPLPAVEPFKITLKVILSLTAKVVTVITPAVKAVAPAANCGLVVA